MKNLYALLCLLLAACGEPPPEPVAEPVALVTLAQAFTGTLPIIIRGYGTVEFDPAGKRTLNAEIEARVLELGAAAGEVVAQDQVLVRLIPSTAGDTASAVSSSTSKTPVPTGASWPSMMFSEAPSRRSRSAYSDASSSTSLVCSYVQRMSAPVS